MTRGAGTKIPAAIVPHAPPSAWTAMAPTGSSIFQTRSSCTVASGTITPATAPVTTAPIAGIAPPPALTATSAPISPA
jgi:hypothetical protein